MRPSPTRVPVPPLDIQDAPEIPPRPQSRTGFVTKRPQLTRTDASSSLVSLCGSSSSDSDSDEEFEKEFYSTHLLPEGDVRDQSFDTSDEDDEEDDGIFYFCPKAIIPIPSILDLPGLVPASLDIIDLDIDDADSYHGRSMSALTLLKTFWDLRRYRWAKWQDEVDAARAAASRLARLEPGRAPPPPVALPPHLSRSPASAAPIPAPSPARATPPNPRARIYPRVGDISQLRDPRPADVDRAYAHLPLNKIQTALYLHDMTMRASDRCGSLGVAPRSPLGSPESSDDETLVDDEEAAARPWEWDWSTRWDVLPRQLAPVVPALRAVPAGRAQAAPVRLPKGWARTEDARRGVALARPKPVKFFFAEEEEDDEDAAVEEDDDEDAAAIEPVAPEPSAIEPVAPEPPTIEPVAPEPPAAPKLLHASLPRRVVPERAQPLPRYSFFCAEDGVEDGDSSLPMRELFCSSSVQFFARRGEIFPAPM